VANIPVNSFNLISKRGVAVVVLRYKRAMSGRVVAESFLGANRIGLVSGVML
jgi:hypothetical protein